MLVQSESSTVSILAWIGLALAIMVASAFAVLQAVDGIANKLSDDSRVAAPPEDWPMSLLSLGIASPT